MGKGNWEGGPLNLGDIDYWPIVNLSGTLFVAPHSDFHLTEVSTFPASSSFPPLPHTCSRRTRVASIKPAVSIQTTSLPDGLL